jgi:hypothetical protein
MIAAGTYKHKKTGKIYQVGGGIKVINTTNAQDGQEMVMYVDPKKPFQIFVREEKEFKEKFTLIKQIKNGN